MKGSIDDLLEVVRKHNKLLEEQKKTEAGKLISRIMSGKKTNQEWLQLREDVINFFKSDALEEDKEMLSGYTESLYMICSAIDQKLM